MSGGSARSAGAAGPAAPVEVGHLPKPYVPPPLKPSLPLGVAVLAVLIALVGIILLIAGALVLLNLLMGTTVVPTTYLITKSVDEYGAAILVVLGAAMLALSRALWDLERWALYVTVGLLFAGLTYLFFTGSITVLFVFALVIFIYLLTVRHHFY
jgi:hypothetical protein